MLRICVITMTTTALVYIYRTLSTTYTDMDLGNSTRTLENIRGILIPLIRDTNVQRRGGGGALLRF